MSKSIKNPRPGEENATPHSKRPIRWGLVIPLVVIAALVLAFYTPPVQSLYKTLLGFISPSEERTVRLDEKSSAVEHVPQIISVPDDAKIADYVIDIDETSYSTEIKGSSVTIAPKNYPMNQPPLYLKIEQIPDITVKKALTQEKKKILESNPSPTRTSTPNTDFTVEPQSYKPAFFEGVWDWVNGVTIRYKPIKSVRIFNNGRGGVFLITEILFTKADEKHRTSFNVMLSSLKILT